MFSGTTLRRMKVATAGITIALFTTSLCSALPPTKKERVHDVVSLLTTSFISDILFTNTCIRIGDNQVVKWVSILMLEFISIYKYR